MNMMEKPKITVIMPALNVVKYIRQCMESVMTQTLQEMEILVIDAGSTDGTLEILQECADRDSRIQIIHSDRKSYGYQLNVGIAMALGEYVGVVETDDWIVQDMYEILYAKAKEINADYVKGMAQYFLPVSDEVCVKKRIWSLPIDIGTEKVVIPKENPILFETDRFLWNGIYRNDFIKEIKLNETPGAAFQDIGFQFQVFQNAERAMYLDKDVYFYRQDNGNASSYDIRAFQYLVSEYQFVKSFLDDSDMEWRRHYYLKMLNQCLGRFRMMAVTGIFWEQTYEKMQIIRSWLADATAKGIVTEYIAGSERWEKLQYLIESPEKLFKKYVQYYCDGMQRIKERIVQNKDASVIIFGCGKAGKFCYALLKSKYPDSVILFCDNNSELWGKDIQGTKVLSPEMAVNEYSDATYIIAMYKHRENVWQQLNMNDILEEQICEYTMGEDLLLFQWNNTCAYEYC